MTPSDLSQYSIQSRLEIIALLRSVIVHHALVTLQSDNSSDAIVSALLDVNPELEQVVLDGGVDAQANRRLLISGSALCTTFLDHVKIQFHAKHAKAILFDGKPAFSVPLPHSVLRLQRRQYYRLEPPIGKPPLCIVEDLLDGSHQPAECKIVDISCGGVGLLICGAHAAVQLGQQFERCRIDLPDVGLVNTGLLVRSVAEIATTNAVRRGLEFIAIPGVMVNMVQRYINKIERERRTRV